MKTWIQKLIILLTALPNFALAQNISANTPKNEISDLFNKVTVNKKNESDAIKIDILKKLEIDQTTSEKSLNAIKSNIKKIESLQKTARGGVDTGGGTLIKSELGDGLLDLYLNNKVVFQDRYINPNNVVRTQALETIGIESIKNKRNQIVPKVEQLLLGWRKKSPFVVNQILEALNNLPMYYHTFPATKKPFEYEIPESIQVKSANLKLSAVFHEKQGAIFSYDELNKLPEKHQIALVIHECLRFINFTGNLFLTNDKIQKLTAELMNSPETHSSVDRLEYMQGHVLLDYLETIHVIYSGINLSKNICENTQLLQNYMCEEKTFSNLSEFINYYREVLRQLDEYKMIPNTQLMYYIIDCDNLRVRARTLENIGILRAGKYNIKNLELSAKYMSLNELIDYANDDLK